MKTADQILDNVMCCTIEEDAEDVKENYYYRHNDVVKAIEQAQIEAHNQAKREMFLNMQYYMEYCLSNKYVTPQEWIEKHKHF